MRAPAVSFAKRFVAAALAALLTFTLLPANAFAEGEGESELSGAKGSEGAFGSRGSEAQQVPLGATSPQPPSDPSTEADDLTPAASLAEGGTLAASLMGRPTAFVNADVALDGEPVVGSFTVDGLTFAVVDDSTVELVGVSEAAGASPRRVVASSQGLSAPLALPDLGSTPAASEAEVDDSTFLLPESVSYNDVEYSVTSIGAYAFYLSGVTSVELPASVVDVDDRAFRSSDVASVEVAEGNPHYSSFDGALYSADQFSLLLIPEGKQGTVLLPKTAESAPPSVFSHCPFVTQVSVEEGSAAFASENGLLYTSDLTTLLRVPAGATDITIREGCTTIAAGAMEACASLATINAPASVTSISSDIFTSVPTISLPAATVANDGADEAGGVFGSEVPASPQSLAASSSEASGSTPQLTAMVALSAADDDLPDVDLAVMKVVLPEGSATTRHWEKAGFLVSDEALAALNTASSYAATYYRAYSNGGLLQTTQYPGMVFPNDFQSIIEGTIITFSSDTTTGVMRFYGTTVTFTNPGCTFVCYSTQNTYPGGTTWTSATRSALNCWAIWNVPITWDANDGYWNGDSTDTASKSNTWTSNMLAKGYDKEKIPERDGYRFLGWKSSEDGDMFPAGTEVEVLRKVTYTAQWERVDYDLGFDVDSEPGDEDYPGIEKPDETVNVESGPTVIEDPKRPGYVFQGWTITSEDSATAIDQELVYQDESDGKWYVDTSKLPDYANDEGRVELTARWTSVISVDVPSAVTFYADVVTEGQESREGAASSAFGQNKVASQSQVDLHIVGLESSAVETQGSTLGADSILKKGTSATPSSSTQKLFSLYPTSKALTADDLQDPDAVSAAKPADAVDFALDDLLLERSFAAEKFTIPAGDTLNLGYRLNLSETGTELDYDKLSTLDEGQSASIANISYCFAADYDSPADWGEPLWIENPDTSEGAPRFLVLDDIKVAAEDLSAHADDPTESEYYKLYAELLDRQVMSSGNPGEGPYFQLKVEGAVGGYLDLQLIGICQDYRTVGGKAGLTFQLKDVYAYDDLRSTAAGGGAFKTYMYETNMNGGSWQESALRNLLRNDFAETLDEDLRNRIVTVVKFQQIAGGTSDAHLQMSDRESIWVPSLYEVYGAALAGYNESEPLSSLLGFEPFQYMAYQGNDGSIVNAHAIKTYNGGAIEWWTRTPYRSNAVSFSCIYRTGQRTTGTGGYSSGVAPAFCL